MCTHPNASASAKTLSRPGHLKPSFSQWKSPAIVGHSESFIALVDPSKIGTITTAPRPQSAFLDFRTFLLLDVLSASGHRVSSLRSQHALALLITIAQGRLSSICTPACYGLSSGINHNDKTKDTKQDITSLAETAFCNTLEVQHWWVDVNQRDTGETTDQCNEFVQIICSEPSDGSTNYDNEEAEDVLLPFDVWIILATASEELVFRDSDGWEELQWCRKQNGERVQELDSVD